MYILFSCTKYDFSYLELNISELSLEIIGTFIIYLNLALLFVN